MSFFLWSSIPDDELRRAAAAGELSNPALLARQVKRMTADPKARRLATEFFGQWLGFYHFDQYRGVDTGRFPEFTDEVKSAMYDEAVSTFEYIVRQERPVKEILYADYTFLNKPLAKFYGVEKDVQVGRQGRDGGRRERVQPRRRAAPGLGVDGDVGAAAHESGQARRLGAAAQSSGRRRRRRRPTPERLPADDKTFNGLTLRQRLAEHKRNATCAVVPPAHRPAGLSARRLRCRRPDRATSTPTARPIDVTGELADKTTIVGTDGLLKYLQTQDKQVMTTLSKKMLGYALGRTVLASDRRSLAEHDGGRRRRLVLGPGRQDRHQPPVPQPRGRRRPRRLIRRRRRPPDMAKANRPSPADNRYPMSINAHVRHPSRRHFLRGVGVALALPWMESLPLVGQARRRPPRRTRPPLRLGHRLLLERRRADSLVGQGQRRQHGARPGAAADDAASRGHGLHPGALQPDRGRVDESAPRAHERAVGRDGQPRPEARFASARRWIRSSPRRSASRTSIPSLVLGIEPNELRLEDGLSMIYGSSLSWVSPTKPATKEIYPSRDLRPPGRRRHGPHARSQHPRRGAAGLAESPAEDQQGATTSS